MRRFCGIISKFEPPHLIPSPHTLSPIVPSHNPLILLTFTLPIPSFSSHSPSPHPPSPHIHPPYPLIIPSFSSHSPSPHPPSPSGVAAASATVLTQAVGTTVVASSSLVVGSLTHAVAVITTGAVRWAADRTYNTGAAFARATRDIARKGGRRFSRWRLVGSAALSTLLAKLCTIKYFIS